MIRSNLSEGSRDRFLKKIEMIPFHPCWEWTAAKNEKGYGVFGVGKETDKAHRISYRIFVGDIPSGMFLLHSCDNPGCVNPNHLRPGTNSENVQDMISRGRNSPPPPMGGHNKKQIPDHLIPLLGKIPDTQIALQSNCTKKVIQRIRKERGIPALISQARFKKGGFKCPQNKSE